MTIDLTIDTSNIGPDATTIDMNDILDPLGDIETHLENILNGAQDAEAIRFAEGSAPATPGSGKWKVYFKSTGLFVIDDAGTEYGPLIVQNNIPFITQTPSGLLSAEQALSALATGLLRVTTTTGVLTSLKEYSSGFVGPGPGDDTPDGYGLGSLGFDTTKDEVSICVDPTGSGSNAAIWRRVGQGFRNEFQLRAANNVIRGLLVEDPTVANTETATLDADGAWVTMPSTGTSGNIAGLVSTTFNLLRTNRDPIVEFVIKTPADITALRYWIGLISADVTNVDTIAGATEFAGFRFSTVAGDTGWTPVTKDSSTQNTGSAIGTVAANTVYRLRIRSTIGGTALYFSVNDGAEQALASNLPAVTKDLGFIARVIPTSNNQRDLLFGRARFDSY